MELSDRILTYRVKHGLSQVAFARRAGISHVTLIRIGLNRDKKVQPTTLYKLAKAMEIDPGELIPGYKE